MKQHLQQTAIRKSSFGGLLLFVSFLTLCSCFNNDETKDKVETITMLISSEIGEYTPWGSTKPVECMLVKEGENNEWDKLSFNAITGFTYEKGYEYKLSVERTTLANPPADGSRYQYKLLKIISDYEGF